MVVASGKVVSVEKNYLWVAVKQQQGCGNCSENPQCCQKIFSFLEPKKAYIKILLEGRAAANYPVGVSIEFGIVENQLIGCSLLLYFVPLLGLLIGAWVGQSQQTVDFLAPLLGAIGFFLGGWVVRHFLSQQENSNDLKLVLLD